MPRSLALGFCLLLFPSPAQSALVYSFDQANYTVVSGGTVDVSVFLTQTAGTTILSDEGLAQMGTRLFFDEAPTPVDLAEVLAVSDITPNPAFDDSDAFFTGQEVIAGQSAGLFDGVQFGTEPIIGDSILLGTFTFTAGAIDGEVTNLRATDFSVFGETISGVNGTELDGMIGDGVATITTASTAVPEPTGVVLGLISVAGLVVRRRRRLANVLPATNAKPSGLAARTPLFRA